MVISCGSCGARYRLDRSLLEGASGARIRCRRCGKSIEVRGTEPANRPPKHEAARATDDLLVRKAAERPVQPPEQPESPVSGATSEPGSASGSTSIREPGAPLAGEALRTSRAEGFSALRNRSRRPKKSRAPYIAIAVGLLLAGTAATKAFMMFTVPGNGTVNVEGERKIGQDGSPYAFERVETYFHRNRKDGSLFILKGLVAEKSGSPSKARILIHAQLLNTNNEVIAEKKVFAGISVSDDFLFSQERETIERFFSPTLDNAAAGGVSPPGSPVPFMVVFFDVPPGVGNFILTAGKEG